LFCLSRPTRLTAIHWLTIVCLSTIFLVASTDDARADKANKIKAAKHYDQGKAYFRVGEFSLCAKEFAASYALQVKSGALFNGARCNEEAGNLKEAIRLFDQYIKADSAGTNVTEATARSAALKTKVAGAKNPEDPGKDPPPGKALNGTLIVIAPDGARILLDSKEVGKGRFEGTVQAGGHTLRVLAEGMRPYQSEVTIAGGEPRSIDVLLEKTSAAVITAPAKETDTFELGVSTATGVKLRGDQPLVVSIRAEAALRLGKRVNLGVFAEYGAIDNNNNCGYSMPGPEPETPFDFGEHFQFNNCSYLLGGAQLYIHVLPEGKLDPYLGIAPGFRAGFTEWTPHLAGEPQRQESEVFPAIVLGLRGGVNYHPRPQMPGWEVGAYVESLITLLGQEASEEFDRDDSAEYVFVTLFLGLRSTVAF
jgi:hypothetical protein